MAAMQQEKKLFSFMIQVEEKSDFKVLLEAIFSWTSVVYTNLTKGNKKPRKMKTKAFF